jgi:uncharacterized membrane protein YqjE
MAESEASSPDLLARLRRLAITLLDLLQTRVELFAVELEEEKHRLIAVLIWTAALIFFGMLAVILITFAVVAACPAPARPWVLAGFCLLYVGLAVRAGFQLRKQLRHRPAPFAGSVGELKKDAKWLRSRT